MELIGRFYRCAGGLSYLIIRTITVLHRSCLNIAYMPTFHGVALQSEIKS